jgi:hypothetical protein
MEEPDAQIQFMCRRWCGAGNMATEHYADYSLVFN